MKHVVDKEIKVPYGCMQCKHCLCFPSCKAFDIIPDEFIDNAALHNHVVDGQKGDYVFETDQAQDTMRVYSEEDC